jgi:hypothetical protein
MRDVLVNYRFFKDKYINRSSRDIEIVYCLDGTLNFKEDAFTYILKNEDIIVINPMKNYEIYNDSQYVYVILTIDKYELKKLINDTNKFFICNSVIESNENYEKLKKV